MKLSTHTHFIQICVKKDKILDELWRIIEEIKRKENKRRTEEKKKRKENRREKVYETKGNEQNPINFPS